MCCGCGERRNDEMTMVTYEFTQELEFEVKDEQSRCVNCPYNRDFGNEHRDGDEYVCDASGGFYADMDEMIEECPLVEIERRKE